MRRARFIKVHPHSFYRIMQAIKEYEKNTDQPVKVKNMLLSKFLITASDYATSGAALHNEVKKAIMQTYGYHNPDPSTLGDDTDMEDFDFSNIQYISLTKKFNAIALKHNATAKPISVTKVRNCGTVKDCIDLVAAAADLSIKLIQALL